MLKKQLLTQFEVMNRLRTPDYHWCKSRQKVELFIGRTGRKKKSKNAEWQESSAAFVTDLLLCKSAP